MIKYQTAAAVAATIALAASLPAVACDFDLADHLLNKAPIASWPVAIAETTVKTAAGAAAVEAVLLRHPLAEDILIARFGDDLRRLYAMLEGVAK